MSNHPTLKTIDKVASRSGIGNGTVDRILKHEVSTSIVKVQALAEIFHVSVGSLLSTDGVLQQSAIYEETVSAIEIMQSLDERGRQRVMLAMSDAVDLHKAHMRKICDNP